jgi:hypothetical protein
MPYPAATTAFSAYAQFQLRLQAIVYERVRSDTYLPILFIRFV